MPKALVYPTGIDFILIFVESVCNTICWSCWETKQKNLVEGQLLPPLLVYYTSPQSFIIMFFIRWFKTLGTFWLVDSLSVQTFQPLILFYWRIIVFIIIKDVHQFIGHCLHSKGDATRVNKKSHKVSLEQSIYKHQFIVY